MQRFLSGIPIPIAGESLISWCQRVCQVYDLTFRHFHEVFETTPSPDQDLSLTDGDILRIASICRIDISHFVYIRNSFCRLAENRSLQPLLLFQPQLLPKYRYCPRCLAKDPVPFLRLEWRFKHWEFCQIHRVPLMDCCPSCRKPLAMHRSVLGGTTAPPPVHCLAICLHCRKDLRRTDTEYLQSASRDGVEIDQIISFQRAIVSAVLHGYFHVAPFKERLSLDRMILLLNHVGLEAVSDKAKRVFAQMEGEDMQTLKWLVEQAWSGSRWLAQGHPNRGFIARSAFRLWQAA